MHVSSLGTAAEVLVATAHDPFARGTLRRPLLRGWMTDGATAWIGIDDEERTSYLSALGDPGVVGALLAELLPELPPRQRLTVPRGTPARFPAWAGMTGTDWDFRWLPEPPPRQRGEERVEPLDDEVAVRSLLAASSSRASAQPGDKAARRWVGVRDASGRLMACAADTSSATGVGHLSSIAVIPEARGQGLGKAVTAALTRQLFEEGKDVVTLGMYADNPQGRALYDALGFRDDHPFTSGPLVVRGRW
ncbi:MAG: GNAT family N-acetyltransferase [Actinomycetota bacterium]|nr:GNAT family N-acetyltransferase [Actinomycetota bacterium]